MCKRAMSACCTKHYKIAADVRRFLDMEANIGSEEEDEEEEGDEVELSHRQPYGDRTCKSFNRGLSVTHKRLWVNSKHDLPFIVVSLCTTYCAAVPTMG